MNTIFKYVPKVGDRVKIITPIYNSYNTLYAGKFGEVKGINSLMEIAEVEVEIEPFNNKTIRAYFEDLQFIRRLDETKNHYICNLTNVNDESLEITETEQEQIELDHICMPTTQDEIEPIDKGEVVEEVGKFVKFLKSKGWSLDSFNLELCNQDDEEDYVIVHL